MSNWPRGHWNWLLVAGLTIGSIAPFWRSISLAGAPSSEPSASLEAQLALLESTGQVFESIARVVSPAVVYLETRVHDSKGKLITEESGSGVLIRPQGLGRPVVVTNVHVIADARPEDIDIYLEDGRLIHPVRIWNDEDTDIALLDPGASDLPAAKLGDSKQVRVGQWVLAIGSPFGLSQSVTHGIISAKHRRQLSLPGNVRIQEFLQTDAAINPGNSGGPLVNLRGEVIGINTAIASNSGSNSGVGFSIPVNMVRWVADELVEHGKVRRGFLGVGFASRFSPARAHKLGLKVARGALVGAVHRDTPAQKGGVLADDVILSFDGTPIEDENHLINVVSQTTIGKSVAVVVWRNGAQQTLHIELGSWESFRQTGIAPVSEK